MGTWASSLSSWFYFLKLKAKSSAEGEDGEEERSGCAKWRGWGRKGKGVEVDVRDHESKLGQDKVRTRREVHAGRIVD